MKSNEGLQFSFIFERSQAKALEITILLVSPPWNPCNYPTYYIRSSYTTFLMLNVSIGISTCLCAGDSEWCHNTHMIKKVNKKP